MGVTSTTRINFRGDAPLLAAVLFEREIGLWCHCR